MELDIIQSWNSTRGFGHTRKGVFVHVTALCQCIRPARGSAVPLGTKVFVTSELAERGERATSAKCAECAAPVQWELRPTGRTIVDIATGETVAETKPVQVSGKPDSWSCPAEWRYRTSDYERAVQRAQMWEARAFCGLSRLVEEFGTPVFSFSDGHVVATWPFGDTPVDTELFVSTVRAKPTGRMSLLGNKVLAEYDTVEKIGDSTWLCAARRSHESDPFTGCVDGYGFVSEFASANSDDGIAALRSEFARLAANDVFVRDLTRWRHDRACLVGTPQTRISVSVVSGTTVDEDKISGLGDGYYYASRLLEVFVAPTERQLQWAQEMRNKLGVHACANLDIPTVSYGGYAGSLLWNAAITVGVLGLWGDSHPTHSEKNPFVPDDAPDPAISPEQAREEALHRSWRKIAKSHLPGWVTRKETILSQESRDRLCAAWNELFDSLLPPADTDPLYQWFVWNEPKITDDHIHEFAHPSGFVAYGYRDDRGQTVWLQEKDAVEQFVASRNESERRKLEERLATLAVEARQTADLAALRAQVAAEEARAAENSRAQREADERAAQQRAEEKVRFAGADEVINSVRRSGAEILPDRETARCVYLFAQGVLGTMSASNALTLLRSNPEFGYGRVRKTRAIAESFPGIDYSGLDWNRDLHALEIYFEALATPRQTTSPAPSTTKNASLADLKAKFGKRK